jgi:anti-sigma factor RsiW
MSQHAESGRCAEVLEQLDAFIDGDLDEAVAKAVKTHVDQCKSCRKELQLAEIVVAELHALPEFDVPKKVLQAVDSVIRPTPVQRVGAFLGGFAPRRVPVFAVAAAVAVMVLFVSQWDRPTEPQFTDREVARAVAETRLALAYVGSVAQRAELRVKERVFDEGAAAQTVRGVQRSIQVLGEAGTAVADPPATPRTQVKGS